MIIVRPGSSFRLWKNCSLCIYILTANPLLALQISTPNHFLFYEPALSRCQINGTEMLRVNLSACFELKTRTASTTAIKRSTSWDGLLRFRAISQDQRVAKTNSFNRKWCCLLSKFGKWLSKFVDLSWMHEKTISEKKHEPSPVFVHCSIFVIARWIILSIYLSTQSRRGVTACQKDAQNLLNMFAWCWCSPPSCRDHTDVTDSTFLISILDRHHLPASMYQIHQLRPKFIGLYLDSLLSLGQLTILAWSTKLSRRKWKEDGFDLRCEKMGLTSGNISPADPSKGEPTRA